MGTSTDAERPPGLGIDEPWGATRDVAVLLTAHVHDGGAVLVDRELRVVHIGGDLYVGRPWPADAVHGRPLAQILPEASWRRVRPHYEAALRGEVASFEITSVLGPAGTYGVQITPVRDASDAIVGALAVSHALTPPGSDQRGRADRVIAHSEAIFAGSTTAAATLDADDLVRRANPALCRLLGRPASALVGRHLDDLLGARRDVLVTRTAVDAGAGATTTFCEVHDLSPLMASERARVAVVEAALDAIVSIDADGVVTDYNPAAEAMFGFTAAEALGRPLAGLIVPPALREAHRHGLNRVAHGHPGTILGRRIEVEALTASGELRPVELTVIRSSERPVGFTAFIRDLLPARAALKMLEATVESLAEGVIVVRADGRVDHVNPSARAMLGHECSLLGRQIDEVVADCPVDDVLLGGTAVTARDATFLRVDGTAFPVSYAVSPLGLLDGSRGVVVTFRDMTEAREREAKLVADLEAATTLAAIYAAMDEDRLVLHAQPIFDVATGALVEEELLVRMIAPDGSVVGPGAFLPVAEATGTILDIDRWVVGRAATLAASGRRVAVNLSARSVGREDVLTTIEQALATSGAAPSTLSFEVTETALTDDVDRADAFATRLAGMGCRLALDDFGTGYGTLTYLKRLPVQVLKIDVEFVRDATRDPSSRKVVEAVVGIARSFGLLTVAEGVEDAATLDLLRELGVDRAQGFHLGRPAPV